MEDRMTETAVAAALPTFSETIAAQYQFCHLVVKTNLQGISDEESRAHPQPGGNPMNWILGHILMVRQALLVKAGGGQPLLGAESTKAYGRGSKPDDDLPERLPDLLALYDRSQEQMDALFARIGDDALAGPARRSPRALRPFAGADGRALRAHRRRRAGRPRAVPSARQRRGVAGDAAAEIRLPRGLSRRAARHRAAAGGEGGSDRVALPRDRHARFHVPPAAAFDDDVERRAARRRRVELQQEPAAIVRRMPGHARVRLRLYVHRVGRESAHEQRELLRPRAGAAGHAGHEELAG